MIKKILLISLVLMLVVLPCVSANDGGAGLDTDRLTFTYRVSQKEAAIGDTISLTLRFTNNTPVEILFEKFYQVFDISYERGENAVDKIEIPPYETVEMIINYTIPEDIIWYEQNGKYYAEIIPAVEYIACRYSPKTDGAWKDYDQQDGTEVYFCEAKTTPIRLTNVYDGSHLAEISILDYKSIIGYNDSAYKEDRTYDGELQCMHVSYTSLKNISAEDIDIVYFTTKHPYESDIVLNPDESSYSTNYSCIMMHEHDLPAKQSIEYKLLFKQGDKYYCTSITKEFDAIVVDTPELRLREVEVETDVKDEFLYGYLVENNTGKDIENLVIYISEHNMDPIDINEFERNAIVISLKDGDAFQLPVTCKSSDKFVLRTGLLVEDQFYYRYMHVYAGAVGSRDENTEIIGYTDSIDDYYYIFNEDVLMCIDPLPTASPSPTPEPTPFLILTTATPTPSPIQPSTTSQIEIVEVERYREPPWVWTALEFALLAVFGVSAYIIIKKCEEEKKNG